MCIRDRDINHQARPAAPIKAPLINDKRLFEDESLYSDIGKKLTPILYISSYLEI